MIAGMVINQQIFINTNAFDEIRSRRRKILKKWYKFNQLCAHFLRIKGNEKRGGAEAEGQKIEGLK